MKKEDSKTIDLAKLASDSGSEVSSMLRELEGHEPEETSPESRWPARFISAGPKAAPKRWPTRFISAGLKGAPKSWPMRFIASGGKHRK